MVKRAVLLAEIPLLELSDLNIGGQTEHTNEGIAPVVLPLKDENAEKESTLTPYKRVTDTVNSRHGYWE